MALRHPGEGRHGGLAQSAQRGDRRRSFDPRDGGLFPTADGLARRAKQRPEDRLGGGQEAKPGRKRARGTRTSRARRNGRQRRRGQRLAAWSKFGTTQRSPIRYSAAMGTNSLWQRFQQFYLHYDDLGFSLDISRMRFPDGLLEKMQPKVEKAFAAMRDLEAGGIANPDENRMVGHYWLRNPRLAPNDELRADIEETNARIQ